MKREYKVIRFRKTVYPFEKNGVDAVNPMSAKAKERSEYPPAKPARQRGQWRAHKREYTLIVVEEDSR